MGLTVGCSFRSGVGVLLRLKSLELCSSLGSFRVSSCAGVSGAEGKVELGFGGETFLRDLKFEDRALVVVGIQQQKAKQVVAQRNVRIEFDGLAREGDTGG